MGTDDVISLVIGVVLFASVIGLIADQIVGAQGGNVTGASSILLGLVVLFAVIVFIRGMLPGKGRR